MGTVYLHIGMPKTGTSALQMFLAQNQQLLNQKGFSYPDMPFSFQNVGQRRNAHFLTLWEHKDDAKEWQQGFVIVREEFRSYDKVILSDENIWSRQRLDDFWESVTEGFSQIGADIRVIVYLRSQDDQVESNWNQKVKDKKTRMQISFEQFMEEERYYYMPFDYKSALDRIASYVGKDNIIVRVYEKQQFLGGNIFSDFLSAVGLELTDDYELPEYAANVRLPNSAVEIKRLINSAYEGEEVPDFYREVISRAFGMKTIQEAPEHDTSMFSPVMREKFMSKYAAGNAAVAREYVHHADGILFQNNLTQKKQWKMDDHEILMDMIRIFAAEGVYQYNRATRLKARLIKLEKQTAAERDRDRKTIEALKERADKTENEVKQMYNSAIFRWYRKLRDKRDKKEDNNEQ